MTIVQTYPATKATVALKPAVAISHMLGNQLKHQLKLFTVIQDGDRWRWRVSYPYLPGKCAAVSTESWSTRRDAMLVAARVAASEQPAECLFGAFEDVPDSAGQPSENREDWVGI